MKKLLFLCMASVNFAVLLACEDGSLKQELALYSVLTPDEFENCVKQGVLMHVGDPSTIRGKMVAVKRSTGNYSIGFVSDDSVVDGRYTVVLERPVRDNALTKQLTPDQFYVIKPARVVVDELTGISIEACEASRAVASSAPSTAAVYPFELYCRVSFDVVRRAYNLAASRARVPAGCLLLMPAGRLTPKEIVLGLLVVVPRSSGDYSVGCIYDKSGVLVARKLKRGEPLDVIVEKPTVGELCTKALCIGDMYAVVRFSSDGRLNKFKVSDIDRGTCAAVE